MNDERSAPHELRDKAAQDAATSKRRLGAYRMPHEDVPPHFTELVQRKLATDEAIVHPARQGGAYKGKVLHADSNFLVQAVGKEGRSAVVHRSSDLEFVSQNLRWRSENDRLGSQNIQIHYTGDKAKVYPFDPQRAPAGSPERTASHGEGTRAAAPQRSAEPPAVPLTTMRVPVAKRDANEAER